MDADFVAFGGTPSPPPSPAAASPSSRQQSNAEAGPSRPKKTGSTNGSRASSPVKKGKKRGRAYDDEGPGPKNLKEERKAKERSAPWCDDVDWSSCRDPAEMYDCLTESHHRQELIHQAQSRDHGILQSHVAHSIRVRGQILRDRDDHKSDTLYMASSRRHTLRVLANSAVPTTGVRLVENDFRRAH